VASYILLCNVTQAGVEALVTDDPAQGLDLPAHVAGAFTQSGGQVQNAFWTLGPHDLVVLADCDSNEQLQAALFALAHQGFVRTTTLTVLAQGPAGSALDAAANVSGHLRGGHLRGGEGGPI
jgi:uncharacterized protein with GYD domain